MSPPKSWPPGTTFDEWSIGKDNTPRLKVKVNVRRWVHLPDGSKKLERLPPVQYRHVADNETELSRFVVRLNGHDPDEDREVPEPVCSVKDPRRGEMAVCAIITTGRFYGATYDQAGRA